MYLGVPYGRVVALDADSGKELGIYTLPKGNQPPTRGLAYWPGDGKHDPEIVFGTTLGGKLIALNAKTGTPVAELRRQWYRRPENAGCNERHSYRHLRHGGAAEHLPKFGYPQFAGTGGTE